MSWMWPFTRKPDPFADAVKANIDGDFSIFAAGADARKQGDVREFESTFNCKLPGDFATYSCSKLGGIYIEAKESVWPKAKEFEVAPFWSFLNGVFVFSLSSKSPEWMNLRVQTELFRGKTNSQLVPCLKLLKSADIYCFDADGALRLWDHETNEAPLQNKSFTEIFAFELAELRKRKDRKKAEAE